MQQTYQLENNKIRAVVTLDGDLVEEKYYDIESGEETLLAESRSGASFGACLVKMATHDGSDFRCDFQDEPVVLFNDSPDEYTEIPKLTVGNSLSQVSFRIIGQTLYNAGGINEFRLTGRSPDGDVLVRKIKIIKDADFFEISNELHLERNIDLEYFTDYYIFASGSSPDFTWTPHIKFDSTCISPDWTFKSPSVMIQKQNNAVALVPDLEYLYEDKSIRYCSRALDMDITYGEGPKLGYGLIPSEPHYHSMFIHPSGLKRPLLKGTISYKYFLFISSNTPEKQIYRRIVHFQWERFGHKNLLNGHQAQNKSFNVMEKEGWHWIGRKFWIEFDYEGKHYGGFRDYHRDLEDDIWFFGWWNSLRTAYGMANYAKRRNHLQTARKARLIFDLVADAPRKGGAIPSVFLKMNGERVWTAGSPSFFGGPIYDYHTFPMCWTAYWLLKWKQDLEKMIKG